MSSKGRGPRRAKEGKKIDRGGPGRAGAVSLGWGLWRMGDS